MKVRGFLAAGFLLCSFLVAVPSAARAGLWSAILKSGERAAARGERAAVGTERVAAGAARAGVTVGALLAVDDLMSATADFERSALIVRREGSTMFVHSNYAPSGYSESGNFQLTDAAPDVKLVDVADAVKHQIDGAESSGDTSAVTYALDWQSAADQGLLDDASSALAGVNNVYLLDDNGIAWPMQHQGDAVAFVAPDGSREIRSDESGFNEKLKEALETAHKMEHAAENAKDSNGGSDTGGATPEPSAGGSGGGIPGWVYVLGAVIAVVLAVNWLRK